MLCSKQFSLSVKLPPYACSLRPPGKFSRLIKESRAVSSEIIGGGGGGGVYSYIRVLPDGFLLKAIVFTVASMDI
jgi:hypothetical protein